MKPYGRSSGLPQYGRGSLDLLASLGIQVFKVYRIHIGGSTSCWCAPLSLLRTGSFFPPSAPFSFFSFISYKQLLFRKL